MIKVKILPSIILGTFILFRVAGSWRRSQLASGEQRVLPGQVRIGQDFWRTDVFRQSAAHAQAHVHGQLGFINQGRMCLECGRMPENPDRADTRNTRTPKRKGRPARESNPRCESVKRLHPTKVQAKKG